jgi:hypothetical protein
MLQFQIKKYTTANKYRWARPLLDRRRTKSKCHVLIDEKLDEISARLEHFSHKSL